MSNTERFITKVEVSESVGCVFANDKTLDYCAQLEYKKSYQALTSAEKDIVDGGRWAVKLMIGS